MCCPTLRPGDVLFFNRKLLHRGGANETDKVRTVILLQAIMPFGVKMEALDHAPVCDNLKAWHDSAGAVEKSHWKQLDEKEWATLEF